MLTINQIMNTSWLTNSFEENTIAWLIFSTTAGSILGSAITLFFDEIIRSQLVMRRELYRVYRKYRNPLLTSADSLERQINTIARSIGDPGLTSQYYRLSTFYKYGLFFFWVRRIELEVGYLDMYSSAKAKEFTSLLYAPFKGICSVRSYFKGQAYATETAIPRDITRAIGEEMFDTEQKLTKEVGPIGFSTFVKRYGSDQQFRIWFESLDQMLTDLSENPKDVQIERLIVTAVHLTRLMSLLDPKGTYTNQKYVNLDIINRKELINVLAKEGIRVNPQSAASPKSTGPNLKA